MNEQDLTDRQALLTSLSEAGGPLTIDAPHATINNPRYFRTVNGNPIPTPARRHLHSQLLEQWQARQPDIERAKTAYLMAGPPGAGKTTAITELLADRLPQFRQLDADEFKRALLDNAVTDGTLQDLLPPHQRSAPDQPAKFYPNELSALVHRESSLLLERAVQQSLKRGENMIIDGTMAWKPWATQLVEDLERHGYTINIVDVETSHPVATERIAHRWRQGHLAALGAPSTDRDAQMGGRWLPQSAVDRLFSDPNDPGSTALQDDSISRRNAQEICYTNQSIAQYDMYWTAAAKQGSVHVEHRERTADGIMETTLEGPRLTPKTAAKKAENSLDYPHPPRARKPQNPAEHRWSPRPPHAHRKPTLER